MKMRPSLVSMPPRWLSLGVGLCWTLATEPGYTLEPEPLRVHVDFEATEDCPDEGAFLAALHRRMTRIEDTDQEGSAVTLRVVIWSEAEEGGYHGSLVMVGDGRVTGERRMDGASCAEVVEALGLAAALSLGSEGSMETARARPHGRAPAAAPKKGAPKPPAPSRPKSPGWRPALGAHAVAEVPLVGWTFIGAQGFVDVQHHGRGPTLGLGFGYAYAERHEAAFGLGKGAASICPVRLPLGRRVDLLPCAVFEAGWVEGQGRNLTTEREAMRTWLAGGIGARLQLDLSRHLFLELGGVGTAPLVKREFVVDAPQRLVGESARISPSGKIGLGVHL